MKGANDAFEGIRREWAEVSAFLYFGLDVITDDVGVFTCGEMVFA
jgi:hypothetical protein